jgi:hypothetical protein
MSLKRQALLRRVPTVEHAESHVRPPPATRQARFEAAVGGPDGGGQRDLEDGVLRQTCGQKGRRCPGR